MRNNHLAQYSIVCDLREMPTRLKFFICYLVVVTVFVASCFIGTAELKGRWGIFTCLAKTWRSIMVGLSVYNIKMLPPLILHSIFLFLVICHLFVLFSFYPTLTNCQH